jgi:hypothetical protein
MSTLGPLQLIAGAGLGNNTAIAVSADLTAAINDYKSTDLIAPLSATLLNSEAGNLLGGLLTTLETLSATNCPALSDSTPSASASAIGVILTGSAASGNSINGFTGIITDVGNLYLGNGDDSIFLQVFTAADGYITSTNQYILAANNSSNYLGSSFTNMNSLITGDLDQVTVAFSSFGADLTKLGSAINLESISKLGSPIALLQQLINVAGLTPRIITELENIAINQEDIGDPPVTTVELLRLERNLYAILRNITGNSLDEVLQILDVTTPGLTSAADLLNPVKIFPNSFFTLTVKTADGLRGIYLNQTGSVNVKLLDSLPSYVVRDYQRLSQAIPADQALANQCLRISLQQIKNIQALSLPQLAQSYSGLTTTKGLTDINSLTSPVPQDVLDYYSAGFATGTGPENTLVLGDLIGAVAGWGYTDPISNTVVALNSLSSDTDYSNLVVTYSRMNTTLSGGYGDANAGPITIPSGPGAGTYTATANVETAAGNAFSNGLIPIAQTYIAGVISNNPTATSDLNDQWVGMAEKIISENNNLASASIDIGELIPNQRSVVLGFVQSLPEYGTDTNSDGTAAFLEQIADKTTQGGQAIVGALRQGQNTALLNSAGIGTNINIPTTFKQTPPQINTTASEYTESEAANSVIR